MEYSGLLVADPGVATEVSCYFEEQRKDPDLSGVDTGFFDWGGYAAREKWVCLCSLSLE